MINTVTRIRNRFIIGTSLAVLIFLGVALINHPQASAAPVIGFNPGRIIDDIVFTNHNSMSVGQIQAFLNSKVPSCDTWGAQPSEFGGGTRAEWGTARGYPPPYICIRDHMENGKMASQIIYDTAKEFSINPQVLIVLLQKEQGLITDTWPTSVQYRTATGYGCPDTAPCDSQYFGLTNQLRWSGRMFRSILNDSPTWYTPYVLGNNFIRWNPNGSCGSSTINIENRSTQALYNYTPYRPNQAALNAGYGIGDGCSSYGNRNFYLYFTDWFGSATGAKPSNVRLDSGVFTISSKLTPKKIDVTNGSLSNGARIQIYDANATAAQQWRLAADSEGYYTIQNVASGKFLDATSGGSRDGTPLQAWSGNGSCPQKWSITLQPKGYIILNKCSGKAVDIAGANQANGAKLQLWSSNGSTAQLWNLEALDSELVEDGLYEVKNTSGLALEIAEGNTANGTRVRLWNSNGTASQSWQFTRQADGSYTIKNPVSGRFLDVINASTKQGAGIQIFNKNVSCAQKWLVSKAAGSRMTIKSTCTNKVVDVAGGTIDTPGAQIQLWNGNGTNAQEWILDRKPVTIQDNGIYKVASIGSLALEIAEGNTANGTRVRLWNSNGTASQSWQFTRQADGSYTIKNPVSGRFLDVRSGVIQNSSPVQLWNGNGSCAQKWIVWGAQNNTVVLHSACSSRYVLDITRGAVGVPGAKIQLFKGNSSGAQRWVLTLED